jgi:hypothetical protein
MLEEGLMIVVLIHGLYRKLFGEDDEAGDDQELEKAKVNDKDGEYGLLPCVGSADLLHHSV